MMGSGVPSVIQGGGFGMLMLCADNSATPVQPMPFTMRTLEKGVALYTLPLSVAVEMNLNLCFAPTSPSTAFSTVAMVTMQV